MKRPALLTLLLAWPAWALVAAETPGDGFKAFRYVRVRNIFDPARHSDPADGNMAKPPPTTTTTSTLPPFLALTGTMMRDEKSLGFFTGSSSEHNRVIGAGESIAGYKVRAITLVGAELEHEGKTLALPVGRQVPLDGANAGTVQPFAPEPSAPPPSPPPSSDHSGGSPSRSSQSSSNDDRRDRGDRDRDDRGDRKSSKRDRKAEDILREMMERRQKETSK